MTTGLTSSRLHLSRQNNGVNMLFRHTSGVLSVSFGFVPVLLLVFSYEDDKKVATVLRRWKKMSSLRLLKWVVTIITDLLLL